MLNCQRVTFKTNRRIWHDQHIFKTSKRNQCCHQRWTLRFNPPTLILIRCFLQMFASVSCGSIFPKCAETGQIQSQSHSSWQIWLHVVETESLRYTAQICIQHAIHQCFCSLSFESVTKTSSSNHINSVNRRETRALMHFKPWVFDEWGIPCSWMVKGKSKNRMIPRA